MNTKARAVGITIVGFISVVGSLWAKFYTQYLYDPGTAPFSVETSFAEILLSPLVVVGGGIIFAMGLGVLVAGNYDE